LSGTIVDFKTFEGNYVLVESFAVGCHFCELQHPILAQIFKEYWQEISILSLAVFPDQDSLDDVIANEIDYPTSWSIGLDSGNFKDDYSIGGTPTLLLFDPEGRVLKRWNVLATYDELSIAIEAYVIEDSNISSESTTDVSPQGDVFTDIIENPIVRMVGIIIIIGALYFKFGVSSGSKSE
jgi:thiol-disulfide isomerase/thioredoxin